MSLQTPEKIRTLQKKLYLKAKAEPDCEPAAVGLEVKSIGKPCARNPHARFDERGWETERGCGLRHRHRAKAAANNSLYPPVTAPILDSTIAGEFTLDKGGPRNPLTEFAVLVPFAMWTISRSQKPSSSTSYLLAWRMRRSFRKVPL